MTTLKTRRTELTDTRVNAFQAESKPYDVTDSICKGLMLRVEPTGQKSYAIFLRDSDNRRYRYRLGDANIFRVYKNTPSKKADRQRSIRDYALAIRNESLTIDLREKKKAAIAKTDGDKVAKLGDFIDQVYHAHYRGAGYSRPDEHIKWVRGAFASMANMRIDAISHLTIRKWQTEALKTRKPSTVARLLQSLGAIMVHAISLDMIDHHPLQKSQRTKPTTQLKKIEFENTRKRYLSEDEEKRLRTALADRDKSRKAARARFIEHCEKRARSAPVSIQGAYFDHLSPLVLLALNTGVRKGALLGLDWSHIKPERIDIPPELDKAKVGYVIPLSIEAKDVLRKWRLQTGGTGKLFKVASIKTAWLKLMRDANITDFRFHDLRHTFASTMVANDVSLYVVQSLLGHQNIETTQRYAHVKPEQLVNAIKVLNR